MAENGILDYQGMNQAIYRGATSNIVVDTQSMSIEIGAGNTSHTSNLHFECNHDANVASIKLNSNVTTEFSRSKKLIKYPRVAMTSGQSGLNTGYTQDGYTIQASSEWGGVHMASNVFNNIQAYQTTDHAWISSNTPDRYTPSSGMATSADTFQDVNGSWVGLTLPEKIKLSSVHLYNRRDSSNSVRPARKGIVWGSDGGSTWYRLKDFTNGSMDGALNVITVESDILYDQFRVQITEMHNDPQKDAVAIGELEFYGVPEYDPDAYGTDVVVKSVPNVPNTDWLEVYYDGQDYTGVTSTVNDKVGTATNATITNTNNEITFDSTYKAWTFGGTDTRTSNFQSSALPSTFSGDQVHSVALWFKCDIVSGDTLFSITQPSSPWEDNNKVISVRFSGASGGLRYLFWSNDLKYDGTEANITKDIWYHLCVTYSGGGGTSDNKKLYLNGNEIQHTSTSGSSPGANLELPSGSVIRLGSRVQETKRFFGSIANFRLFNRAITQDEIYQLYAYQKEYFGHGDLSMTLKAGRLGIGTSEPRAALDVQGDIYGGCPVFFRARKTTDSFGGTDPIIWNETMVNKGGGYDTTTGKFTAPVSGYYEFIYGGVSGREDWSAEIFAKKNGVKIDGSGAYTSGGDGHWARHLMNTVILELNQGDVFHLYIVTGNQDFYGTSTYSYNFFSGKYLSN